MSATTINNSSPLRLDRTTQMESSPATGPAGALATTSPRTISKSRLVTGRVLSTLATLFLLFDAFGKIVQPAPVLQASARIGFPSHLLFGVGVLLLICTVAYAIPRTAVLGAVLLTGFLGGAAECQLAAASPTFEALFPVLFGILVWAGIYLREPRISQLFPLRCAGR
jgi:DoxX-like protein